MDLVWQHVAGCSGRAALADCSSHPKQGDQVDERIIRGHFGFDRSRRLMVSMDNRLELRMVIDHSDGSAYIALDESEVQRLRDTLSEWLERGRKAPAAATRHPKEGEPTGVRRLR
jgi:hypothetical protein